MLDRVTSLLLQLTKSTSPSHQLYAFKGLGHLCVRRPALILECKDVLEKALTSSAPAIIKRQALANLSLLLQADEERVKAHTSGGEGQAFSSKSNKTMAAEMSAAITGALQLHQSAVLTCMLDGKQPAVRQEALSLITTGLRRGICHPIACLPNIMALELDAEVGGCAEAARELLKSLYERYQQIAANPATTLRGAICAFHLQRSLPEVCALACANLTNWVSSYTCLFEHQGPSATLRPTFVYSLLSNSRKERMAYLKVLIKELDVDQLKGKPESSWEEVVALGEWLAEAMAEMPYEREEEPLTVIYLGKAKLYEYMFVVCIFATASATYPQPHQPLTRTHVLTPPGTLTTGSV